MMLALDALQVRARKISPHLTTSHHISPHLTTSHHISLQISPDLPPSLAFSPLSHTDPRIRFAAASLRASAHGRPAMAR